MRISRRAMLLAPLAPFVLAACAEAAAAQTVTVVKTPTCGCCGAWVEHLRAAGFEVTVTDVEDVTPTARELGVPDDLRSCHTASVGGYAVEGHVPVEDIRRLLAERPDAAGIAVPGMPIGSPGMEMGDRREPYQTLLFRRDGQRRVFASH
ncbi:DUF411 domain-containing protein [Sphingosinicella sp. LHD-64]|uniref:DUF411 domain-containing protein n=1 Tax=Sphingosinicella sp. LHD-64 TaxID=3072139 RepID=UPI00280EB4C5|nr:DUF411 domain-containing protein [Sphingosinicella sp. LHD-64]MDQ8756756.1 DUF411 domain-containing protein [Sphingosinicella sp. LHD-64]